MGAERILRAPQRRARRGGRGAVLAVIGLLASLVVQVGLLAPVADAARLVANPGPFSMVANSGAAKMGAQTFTFEGADAQNVSFTGTIASDGTITVPGSGIKFPPQQVSAAGQNVTVRINGVGATGSLNPATGALSLTVRVWIKIDGIPLGGDCHIGSSSSPVVIPVSTSGVAPALSPSSGSPYNPVTGGFVVANNTFAVPGAADCGLVTGTVNSEVGLPSPAGSNQLVIDANVVPSFQPAVINLSASPNPVVVNKTTTLSAAGTTTTNLVRFDWDLDGNGSYETTGTTSPTRTISFPTTGTKTVGVKAVYSDGNDMTRTTTITVVANSAPVAPTQNLTTPEDTALPVTLAATDANNDPLTFSLLTTPPAAMGVLSGTAPNLTFTPAADVNGSTSFTYRVDDGNGGTADGTVNITITPVNDAPVAQDATLAVVEDVAKPVTLVATDVDGDNLTYEIVAQGSKGVVTCSPPGGPSCTYTPDPDANGPDSFTFAVSDGNGGTDTGTVAIAIASVNDVPTVDDVAVETDEDTPVAVTLTGSDPDGDPLTFNPTSLPAHGSLTGTPPNLTYTPAANYHGVDAFTFTAADGNGGLVAGTATITVHPVNDPPTATDLAVTTPEGEPLSFQLLAGDVDGTDTLTFTVDAQPSSGTVDCDDAGACTYTPDEGFAGTDTFTFTVDDGQGGTDSGTVTITVVALVNYTPVITTPASVAVLEDTPRTITLSATDGDGDPVAFTVLAGPALGVLTDAEPPVLVYTPGANVNGTDSIVVQASDGRGGIATKTISLTIIPVNDAPVAVAQSFTLNQGTSSTVTLVASDGDGDALTWSRRTGPSHGTASVAGDQLTYTPDPGFVGTDTVDVEATDPSGARSRVTITFVVADVDEAPVAGSVGLTVLEDSGATAVVLPASDPDGGGLAVAPGAGALGTLDCAGLSCTYTPDPDANGVDTVPYTVTDDDGVAVTGSVVVTILPQADDPQATDIVASAAPGQTIEIELGGTDPDGEALVTAVTSAPTAGTIGGTPPAITYTAPAALGTVTFTFSVTDPTGRSATGTVAVTVQPQPQPPTAVDQALVTPEDTALAITLEAGDPDGAVAIAYSQPSHGTVTGVAPFVTYVPAGDYHGPDAFAFTATDGDGNEATGTVSITVTPVNDRPAANGAAATTTRTAPVAITLSATDVDGDPVTYSLSSGPAHGTVTIAGDVATYTPAGLFTGTDAFVFRATDPEGRFGSATVTVTVGPGGNLATQLTPTGGAKASSALLGLQWTYTNLNARLTVPAAGGEPLVGHQIQFRIGSTVICTGVTDATGRAACGGSGPLLGARATTYTAVYAGSTGFSGTSVNGGIA